MNVPELHRRAVEEFDRRVQAVGDDHWATQVPCCPGWDVRTLVNHLVNENMWTSPIMHGSTVEEIGDQFDGNLLGDDPKGVWESSSKEAVEAVREEGAMDRTVHLSFGDFAGRDYALQLFADHLIHAWDLARSIEADDRLDPELVEACAEWFVSVEDFYRSGGAIAERPTVPDGADPQTRLLAMFGRSA